MLELPHPGVKEFYLPENNENTIKFMVAELKKFVAFLETTLKEKMDYDRLEQVVSQTLKTLRIANKVELLRTAVPSPHGIHRFLVDHDPPISIFQTIPKQPNFISGVYDEVKARVDQGLGAIPDERYRMLFTELPPWHSLGFFGEIAEKYGIAIVQESYAYKAPTVLGGGGVRKFCH